MPKSLTPQMLGLVAERLRALAEPARLQILNQLRDDERTVTELVEATGLGQANVSKHLQLLLAAGFVSRRKEGLFTYYRLADHDVFRVCEIMCGRLESEARRQRHLLGRG
ncbi:MAG TPA: metalloregulator ArsR/SmtB family transcription factor [Gemmatimonadales bacterium]|nr:metalloregulator ArsR/SmtB family transcription factor [Gemmatimonadales bacterium]